MGLQQRGQQGPRAAGVQLHGLGRLVPRPPAVYPVLVPDHHVLQQIPEEGQAAEKVVRGRDQRRAQGVRGTTFASSESDDRRYSALEESGVETLGSLRRIAWGCGAGGRRRQIIEGCPTTEIGGGGTRVVVRATFADHPYQRLH